MILQMQLNLLEAHLKLVCRVMRRTAIYINFEKSHIMFLYHLKTSIGMDNDMIILIETQQLTRLQN